MSGDLSSFLFGTVGLSIALAVSVGLAGLRPRIAQQRIGRIRRVAGVALTLQLVHFAEEYRTGFYERFPDALGLAPWPAGMFVGFNVFWILVWILAIVSLARLPRCAAVPLWFLAIAAAANGVAHPLLALSEAGYFPGLWSSLLLGAGGVVLLRELAAASRGNPAIR